MSRNKKRLLGREAEDQYYDKKGNFIDVFLLKIEDTNIINKGFQKLFIAFILLRLFIMKNTFLFILINLVLTYFLLFNKNLITLYLYQ